MRVFIRSPRRRTVVVISVEKVILAGRRTCGLARLLTPGVVAAGAAEGKGMLVSHHGAEMHMPAAMAERARATRGAAIIVDCCEKRLCNSLSAEETVQHQVQLLYLGLTSVRYS